MVASLRTSKAVPAGTAIRFDRYELPGALTPHATLFISRCEEKGCFELRTVTGRGSEVTVTK